MGHDNSIVKHSKKSCSGIHDIGESTCWTKKNILPVFMNEGIKSQAVSPTGCEVAYIDIGVAGSFHLTPK